MSCLQNEVLLETLFEEALEEVTNNNHLQFNDAELQFNAEILAQQIELEKKLNIEYKSVVLKIVDNNNGKPLINLILRLH